MLWKERSILSLRGLLLVCGIIVLAASPVVGDASGQYREVNGEWYWLIDGVFLWVCSEPNKPLGLDELVVEARPDPDPSGTLLYRQLAPEIYMWNNQPYNSWWEWDTDWGAIMQPTITVSADPSVEAGDFISSDQTYALAEVEADFVWWQSQFLTTGSGHVSFSPFDDISPTITFHPDSAPSGRTYALSYRITGTVGNSSDYVDITQDLISRIRQEYVDVNVSGVYPSTKPPRAAFSTANQNLNYGQYTQAITTYYVNLPQKVGTLPGVSITSAYRNPRKNKTVGGSGNSYHIYGRAIDYNQGSSQANYNMWVTSGSSPGMQHRYLYDQYRSMYANPSWPAPGGIEYRHGHADW